MHHLANATEPAGEEGNAPEPQYDGTLYAFDVSHLNAYVLLELSRTMELAGGIARDDTPRRHVT